MDCGEVGEKVLSQAPPHIPYPTDISLSWSKTMKDHPSQSWVQVWSPNTQHRVGCFPQELVRGHWTPSDDSLPQTSRKNSSRPMSSRSQLCRLRTFFTMPFSSTWRIYFASSGSFLSCNYLNKKHEVLTVQLPSCPDAGCTPAAAHSYPPHLRHYSKFLLFVF